MVAVVLGGNWATIQNNERGLLRGGRIVLGSEEPGVFSGLNGLFSFC